MSDLPFIFFAFANSDERYLPNLRKERQGIMDFFLTAKYQRQLLDFHDEAQASSSDFFSIFSKIGHRVNILHFSGHANSFAIDLDDDEYSLEQLLKLIGGFKNLQLVFLNGCSTKEMVEALLASGIKAVIATSEDVADNRACDFSVSFYKAFVEKGRTLEQAFKMAVSTLKNNPIKDTDLFIGRSVIKRDEFKNKALPWALYYREEDKLHLKWRLIETDPDLRDLDTAFLKKIEVIRKKIAAQQSVIETCIEKLKQWETVPHEVRNTPFMIEKEKEDKTQLKNAETSQFQLLNELSGLLTKCNKAELENRLDQALSRLNYKSQIQAFEDEIANNNLMAFLLQGSLNCGQDLLKERLIDIAGLRYHGEFYQEIKIEFNSRSYSSLNEQTVWSRIKEELLDLNSSEPRSIVKEIYDQYFSQQKDLVFIFDNVHVAPPEQILSLIKHFWEIVLEVFQDRIASQATTNKVLLLIIDKNCILRKQGDCFSSNKENIYRQFLDAENSIKDNIQILPMVTPLFFEDLRDWKTGQQLPNDLVSKDMLKLIAGSQGNEIMPTIEKICVQTKMDHLYQSKYQKYSVRHKL